MKPNSKRIYKTFNETFSIAKSMEKRSRLVAASGLGDEGMGVTVFNRYGISIQVEEKVLKLDSGDGCTCANVLNATELCTV